MYQSTKVAFPQLTVDCSLFYYQVHWLVDLVGDVTKPAKIRDSDFTYQILSDSDLLHDQIYVI